MISIKDNICDNQQRISLPGYTTLPLGDWKLQYCSGGGQLAQLSRAIWHHRYTLGPGHPHYQQTLQQSRSINPGMLQIYSQIHYSFDRLNNQWKTKEGISRGGFEHIQIRLGEFEIKRDFSHLDTGIISLEQKLSSNKSVEVLRKQNCDIIECLVLPSSAKPQLQLCWLTELALISVIPAPPHPTRESLFGNCS